MNVRGCAATPGFLKNAEPWSFMTNCCSVLASVTWKLLDLCEREYIII